MKKKTIKPTNKKVRKKLTSRKLVKKENIKKSLKISRLSTNIDGLNNKIQGGFIKNSTNLIIGGSGAGKSILGMQFLMGGMKNGEKCLYVTFEEKKEQFFNNMKQFGWDLEFYEKKGLFTFLEYTPLKIKTMLEEGGGTIESVILNKKISRMIIDSITSFDLLFESNLEKRESAISLFNMVNRWNVTTLLTLEGKPLRDERMDTRTLEFESDSIILLYYVRSKGERHRYIEVLKMRGTKHSKNIYRFEIGNKGIKLLNKPITGIKV
jgi:circadian clock protein KaiC